MAEHQLHGTTLRQRATKAVAVTINPAWHVPKSIVAKEIQPKLDQDSDYLES